MGLFDQVMKAVADPNRRASMGQMSQIMTAAKQVAQNNNADSETMQTTMSVIGGFVRDALKQKRQTDGDEAAEALIREGSANGAAVIPKLFQNNQINDMVSAVVSKTSLNTNQVQGILPVVLPLVMQFLGSGSAKGSATGTGQNPILTAFLDGDGDGDVDMGDMIGMAGKFM